MSDPTPPPERSHCPNHCLPLLYAGSFDGERIYECPAPRCTIQLLVSIPQPETKLPDVLENPPQP